MAGFALSTEALPPLRHNALKVAVARGSKQVASALLDVLHEEECALVSA